MIAFPARAKRAPECDDSFQSLSSRPVSPLPSPSAISHSASSSTYFFDHRNNNGSLVTLPTSPRLLRRNSSSSSGASCSGSSVCPTPHSEFTKNGPKISIEKVSPSTTSFEKSGDPSSYEIETLHEYDDVEFLSPWKRRLYRLSPLFTFLAAGAYFLYYGYRIHCTIYAQRAFHVIYVMAWLFISAEACVACKFNKPGL
jgi:hypothetical protein